MKSSENRIFSSSRSSQFAVHDKYNEASLAWAPSEKEWSGKVSFTSPLLTTRSRTEAFSYLLPKASTDSSSQCGRTL